MKKEWTTLWNFYRPLQSQVIKYKIISFDIFDTLIVRKCGSPVCIFQLVEDEFNKGNHGKIGNFVSLRMKMEAKARKESIMREISIEDIYIRIAEKLGKEKAGILKELELRTEMVNCVARKEIVDLYHQLLKEKDVIITSDMYLAKDFIIQLLVKNDIEVPSKLYISSERNATKHDGSLYKLVVKELGCKPSDILHVGDNFKSDFVRPMLLNIHSYIVDRL